MLHAIALDDGDAARQASLALRQPCGPPGSSPPPAPCSSPDRARSRSTHVQAYFVSREFNCPRSSSFPSSASQPRVRRATKVTAHPRARRRFPLDHLPAAAGYIVTFASRIGNGWGGDAGMLDFLRRARESAAVPDSATRRSRSASGTYWRRRAPKQNLPVWSERSMICRRVLAYRVPHRPGILRHTERGCGSARRSPRRLEARLPLCAADLADVDLPARRLAEDARRQGGVVCCTTSLEILRVQDADHLGPGGREHLGPPGIAQPRVPIVRTLRRAGYLELTTETFAVAPALPHAEAPALVVERVDGKGELTGWAKPKVACDAAFGDIAVGLGRSISLRLQGRGGGKLHGRVGAVRRLLGGTWKTSTGLTDRRQDAQDRRLGPRIRPERADDLRVPGPG